MKYLIQITNELGTTLPNAWETIAAETPQDAATRYVVERGIESPAFVAVAGASMPKRNGVPNYATTVRVNIKAEIV